MNFCADSHECGKMVQVQDAVVGLKSAEQAGLRYILYAFSWSVRFADISRPAPTGLEGEGTLQDAVRGAFIFFNVFFCLILVSVHSFDPMLIDL